MNPSGGETRLGDVIVENPKSTLKVRESISDGEFPFFSSGEVVSSFDKHICDGENLFIATGGKASVHYHDGKAAYSTDCFSITTRAILLPKFLFLFLESILPQIDEQMFEGAALRHLQKGRLRDTRMPLPPLPEQRRIVGILDEAFKYIAVAKANAQRNRQGGRALYDSHLHSVFSQRGSEWERLKLSTLLERGWIESHLDGNHGSNYPRKQEFVEDGVPYVSANCIDDERVDMSRAKYLSPARAGQLRKGIARHNDVLFAHNATVGPVAILRTSEPKVILSTSLTYYRCNPQRSPARVPCPLHEILRVQDSIHAGNAAVHKKPGPNYHTARLLSRGSTPSRAGAYHCRARRSLREQQTPRQDIPEKGRCARGVEAVAAAQRGQRQSPEPPMNEAETRAEHIDPALKAAGWGIVEGSRSSASIRSLPAGSKGSDGVASR